jgi:CHAT domain-containing protein
MNGADETELQQTRRAMGEMKESPSIAPVQYAAAVVCALLGACTAETTGLRTNMVRDGSISGALPENFQFSANNGEKLRIWLAQSGNDLQLELTNDSRQVIAAADSFTGRYGEDHLSVEIQKGGRYWVTVSALRNPKVPATFTLNIERVIDFHPGDQAFSDASRIDRKLSPPERIRLLDEAAKWFGSQSRFREQGLASLAANNILNETASDAPSAIERGEEAVRAFRQTSAPLMLASALTALATAYGENRDGPAMQTRFEEARHLFEERNSLVGVAEADLYEAVLNYSGVDDRQILATFKSVAKRCAKLDEAPCLALALQDVGVFVRNHEDVDLGLDYLKRALSLVDPIVNSREYSDIADNLAFTLRLTGDFDEAIQYHGAALASFLKYGECSGISRSYYGLGYSLLGIGDNDQAPQFFYKGVGRTCTLEGWGATRWGAQTPDNFSVGKVCEQIRGAEFVHQEDRSISSWTAWDLGNFARSQSDPEAAFACHTVASELLEWPSDKLGTRLESVRDLLESKRTEEAAALYEGARKPLKSAGPRNRAFGVEVLGMLQAARGNDVEAIRTFSFAAQAYRDAKFHEGEFSVLSRRASLSLRHQPGRSDRYFEEADASLERVRLLSLDPAFSASLFASGRRIYEDWIESRLSRRSVAHDKSVEWQTLAISERSRGRLLAQIAKAYRANEKSRSSRLRFVASKTADLLKDGPADPIRKREPEPISKGVREPQAEVQRFDTQEMKKSVERLHAFQLALDDSTTVIEYLLGESRSHAWLMTRDKILRVELPAAATIRSAATSARESLLKLEDEEKVKRGLGNLYEVVLGPLATSISGDRLVIVPDDALHEIPFAALWDAHDRTFLIERFDVSYLPSIQLAGAREQVAKAGAPARALLVGDPVYDSADAVERCSLKNPAAIPISHGRTLRRLPASGREIKSVEKAFREGGVETRVLVACDASRDNVLSEGANRYRFVHFATHATADRLVPHRSAIHLSAFGRDGAAMESELSAADLLDRPFTTDLTVLSGCSTAGGRRFSGEGAMGLSFSLMAAGSRQVVSTLWSVADSASAEAMGSFYQSYLSSSSSASAALRATQLQMLSGKRWSHPRHWAAYTIFGS